MRTLNGKIGRHPPARVSGAHYSTSRFVHVVHSSCNFRLVKLTRLTSPDVERDSLRMTVVRTDYDIFGCS